MRYFAFFAIVCAIALTMGGLSGARADPPNALVFVVDDVGMGDLGFSGSGQIRTPNLDRLAREGVIFSEGYAPSSVCSPSRAGIMTGKYPQRFGHENNQPAGFTGGMPTSEVTLAEVLRGAGYATGMVGKWHLGSALGLRPRDQGFDTFYGFLGAAREYFPPINVWRNDTPVTETRYLTDAFGDEAVAFINENAERPFFLYLAFNAAHQPLQATEEYLGLPWVRRISDQNRRTFAAMVAALDENVGKVHRALKANRLDRRTLIFFTGDNGGAPWAGGTNAPLRGAKGALFEGGVRTPMFARWPRTLPSGLRYPHPVSGLDIFPTVAAAAGSAAPSALDGVNLLPYTQAYLDGEPGGPHEKLFFRIFGGRRLPNKPTEWKAARVGDLKLIEHDGRSYVFNLADDPGETRNIATPALLARLRREYNRWAAQMRPAKWCCDH